MRRQQPSALTKVDHLLDINRSAITLQASLKGELPKSSDCLRGFITVDVIKAHSLMATVEKAYTAGIPDEGLHFGLPDEPTGAKVGLCLREFERIVIHCGMDPVLNIIQENGPAFNM